MSMEGLSVSEVDELGLQQGLQVALEGGRAMQEAVERNDVEGLRKAATEMAEHPAYKALMESPRMKEAVERARKELAAKMAKRA